MSLNKFFWWLSIISIPLLMLRYYRIADIPLTHLFLFAASAPHLPNILKEKTGKIEKSMLLLVIFFIFFSFFDLPRTKVHPITFFYEIKLVILLFTLKFYSYLINKFSLHYFLKYLSLSSTLILLLLLLRSLFILNAPFFVVDQEIITEQGKNQVAFYLALIIPMIFYHFKSTEPTLKWKMIIISALLIHLFAAIYVQSRGVLFSLGLGSLITFFIYNNPKLKFSSIVKLGFLTIVLFLIFTTSSLINLENFQNEITSLFADNIQEGSASKRLILAEKAINSFYENPIIGIGTNNFEALNSKVTHNNYLQILAENGLAGIFILVIILLRVNRNLIKLKIPHSYYLLSINLLWVLLIYLLVINGLFNAITMIAFSIVIYYEKYIYRKNTDKLMGYAE